MTFLRIKLHFKFLSWLKSKTEVIVMHIAIIIMYIIYNIYNLYIYIIYIYICIFCIYIYIYIYIYLYITAHHFNLLHLNHFDFNVNREGWWFEHSVS